MNRREPLGLTRRELLKAGLVLGGAALIGPRSVFGAECFGPGFINPFDAADTGLGAIEVFPTSPFILKPFTDPLPIPPVLSPSPLSSFVDRNGFPILPGPGSGRQDSLGARPRDSGGVVLPDAGTHQLWPSALGLPDPILYHIRLQVSEHRFTTSPVQTLVGYADQSGNLIPAGTIVPSLPASTIYGFNGTFPGPRINAEYGKPILVRFENDLDLNPQCLDRQDFGAPDWAFLAHLYNGHTAPESDGNPHHMTDHKGGYQPGEWVDNLYLNYPAGGDAKEMQSFLWFHDHRMGHAGANTYKGMVGLYPLYDPRLDSGDETKGLRLPGVRHNNPDGTFSVDYDIPLTFYDCRLDDGITQHQDFHNGLGELHPEWWGQLYFRHFPNHGFVGDVFTVNGVAYPVLEVRRRKYRLRFLDASVSRIYTFKLMSSTGGEVAAPGTQGQWQLPDGRQCMRFTQIASDGGLLPASIVRDSFQLWPGKRREFIVDFTRYEDGSPTRKGEVIYLVNMCNMPDGRKPANFEDPTYRVPVLKIVIGDNAPDNSLVPKELHAIPPLPGAKTLSPLLHRSFTLQRSGAASGEDQWLVNGVHFDPAAPLALLPRDSAEVWTIVNGFGGAVFPLHIHQEEHRVISRSSTNAHPDDTSKEDVVALDPLESVRIYRKFRTFRGKYVAHSQNLAQGDHGMMFGWTIV